MHGETIKVTDIDFLGILCSSPGTLWGATQFSVPLHFPESTTGTLVTP